MRFIKKNVFLFLFSLALSVSFSENCQAQEMMAAKGFSVAPFFQEVTLEKDQPAATFAINISNHTENVAVLKLSTVDFGALDETGGVAFVGSAENLTNKYALSSWMILEKDAIVLNAGETQAVRITIQNRESLTPGGHYTAIMARLDSGKQLVSDNSEVALEPSFSALIFARKMGGEIFGMSLKSKDIIQNVVGLPSSVRLRFQNTGNIYLTPRGLVRLHDPLGREVSRGIINEESAMMLPETFRIFPTAFKKSGWAFIPGVYKIYFEYRYDGKSDPVLEQQNIFLLPWVDVIALLLAISAGGLWFRQNRKKKNVKK